MLHFGSSLALRSRILARAALLLLLVQLLVPAAAAGPVRPPRVLVLYSGSRLLPANVLFDESLRRALSSSGDDSIECCGEFLDQLRFPVLYEERMRDLLRDKYGEHPADVVVAFAAPSLEFCLRNRAALLPNAPILFSGPGSDTLAVMHGDPWLTGLRPSFDGPATLRLALRLHPRTREICVITDPAAQPPDHAIPEWVRLSEKESRIPFRFLHPPTWSSLPQELHALPANSVVLDLTGLGSSADPGAPPAAVMRRMSETCSAPIYSVFDPLVGDGLVGAVTTPVDALGRATAALVLQVLSRPPGAELPAVRSLAAIPVVDWRQLRRFGVRGHLLPAGSIVRFEPPSFWRQHLALVVTTSLLFLLQSGLILALVIQSRRRHRAEIEARHRREELAHMTRVATMGELTASLAHEINQPLAAILSNAQAAQRLLGNGKANLDEIREILADIASDDQRAGEVIRRMRTLLRKGEFNPVEVDVNELVDEVAGLVRGEMILQNVSLFLDHSPVRLVVQGDRVQLQQVLLNLMVNALDAIKEVSTANRKVIVRTAPDSNGRSVRVSVQDSGVGVPPDRLEQIFEAFLTTKTQGLGLGLAICRSIIQSHGGRIGSSNNPDRGATFWFTLPALEEARR